MSRRAIVPDTSIVVAAFFNERYSREATRLVDAIERHQVSAFAPFSLIVEFLGVAQAKCSGRQGSPRFDPVLVDEQVERFFELAGRSITWVREDQIQRDAWELMMSGKGIPPPDSWMLACARSIPEAELWVTHDHADGFVGASRKVHRDVFTLSNDAGKLP